MIGPGDSAFNPFDEHSIFVDIANYPQTVMTTVLVPHQLKPAKPEPQLNPKLLQAYMAHVNQPFAAINDYHFIDDQPSPWRRVLAWLGLA
jgi:hypothetical protein